MDEILTHARAILVTTPTRWRDLCSSANPELLTRPPALDQWSALECLQHLVDTEEMFRSRVQAFLADLDIPRFDPDSHGTHADRRQAPVELARRFSSMRDESLADLTRLSPADLDRAARHEEYGQVTLGQMMHEWAAHDLMHTVQAERALMQPFIAGSGPWRSTFADHIAEP